MTAGISNNFIMSIENKTVYHTGDVMRIFNRMVECTPDDGSNYYKVLSQDDIGVFRIIYPSYSDGDTATTSWSNHKETLFVSIPRLSKLKSQPASLSTIAGAYEEVDSVADNDYIYFACRNMIHNVAYSMLDAMNRTGEIDLSGLKLRYCERLTKRRKVAQRLHILEHENEYLIDAGKRLRALEACYSQDIKDARLLLDAELAGKK